MQGKGPPRLNQSFIHFQAPFPCPPSPNRRYPQPGRGNTAVEIIRSKSLSGNHYKAISRFERWSLSAMGLLANGVNGGILLPKPCGSYLSIEPRRSGRFSLSSASMFFASDCTRAINASGSAPLISIVGPEMWVALTFQAPVETSSRSNCQFGSVGTFTLHPQQPDFKCNRDVTSAIRLEELPNGGIEKNPKHYEAHAHRQTKKIGFAVSIHSCVNEGPNDTNWHENEDDVLDRPLPACKPPRLTEFSSVRGLWKVIDVPDVVTDNLRENRFEGEGEGCESHVQKRNRTGKEDRHPA